MTRGAIRDQNPSRNAFRISLPDQVCPVPSMFSHQVIDRQWVL